MRSLLLGFALMAVSAVSAQSGSGASPLRMPKASCAKSNDAVQQVAVPQRTSSTQAAKVRPWRPAPPPAPVIFGLRAEWMD